MSHNHPTSSPGEGVTAHNLLLLYGNSILGGIYNIIESMAT